MPHGFANRLSRIIWYHRGHCCNTPGPSRWAAETDCPSSFQQSTHREKEQVLSNIAMLSAAPGGMPHIAVPSTGTTQTQDAGSSDVGLQWNPTTLVAETLGISGRRALVESWNAVPVTKSGQLQRLRCAFQIMMNPPAIDIEHVECAKKQCKKTRDCYKIVERNPGCCTRCVETLVKAGFLVQPEDGKEVQTRPLVFACREDAIKYAAELQQDIACKLPSCWYGVSKWCDVPSSALYKGRYRGYVAWVNRQQVDALARATMSILRLAVLETTEPTVELRKYFKTEDGGFVEVKGTATGDITEFVTDGDRKRLAQSYAYPAAAQNEELPAPRIGPAPGRDAGPQIFFAPGTIDTVPLPSP